MKKVKNIISQCALCLNLTELAAALNADETISGDALTEENDLIRCLNIVSGDLSIGAVTLKKTKAVAVTGGSLLFSRVDDALTDVLKLYDDKGNRVRYTVYSDRLLAPDGVYTLEYSFVPGALSLGDDLPFPSSFPDKLLVYGINCEFCLAYGRNDEAVKWESLYSKELERLDCKKLTRGTVLPYRSWL